MFIPYPWSSSSAGIFIQHEHLMRFSTNMAWGRQSRIRILDSLSGVSRLYRSCAVTHLSEPSVAADLANELGDSRPVISVPNIHDKSLNVKNVYKLCSVTILLKTITKYQSKSSFYSVSRSVRPSIGLSVGWQSAGWSVSWLVGRATFL